MISPKNMKTIQIELTNACPHSCSNCTRFCGWHEKPFFMDKTTFRKALKSLEGFPGMIGIMGGEPTLHPDFKEMVSMLVDATSDCPTKRLIIPEDDMNYFRETYLSDIGAKRGLWSSLGPGYKKHFSLINKAFRYQCINDHKNLGEHQALLLPRKELGIPDDEWAKLRDKCWIQNQWSASITPKGAFFCEVAAALDYLFDGPGGWPIEPGWWLRRPQEFGDQLNWCEYCSACLPVPGKPGQEEVDIISPEIAEKLATRNAPKAKQHRYEIFTRADYEKFKGQVNTSPQPYLGKEDKRVALDNDSLTPKEIQVCTFDENTEIPALPWERIDLKQLASKKEIREWVLFFYGVPPIPQKFEKLLTTRVYHPNCFYLGDGWAFFHKNLYSQSTLNAVTEPFRYFSENIICYVGTFKAPVQTLNYSFLVPTYNNEKTFEKAISGILNQDYTNFQIYIVDDCSTDGTWELIQELQKQYPDKVKASRHKQNQSAVYSRMDLVEMATGDYCVWVDADDEISPNFCNFASYILKKHSVEILDLPFRVNSVGPIKNYGFRDEEFHNLRGRAVYDFFCLQKKNPFNLWSKAISTDLLKRSKIERTRIDLVDDMAIAFPLYWNAKSYLSLNSERMYIYNYGAGFWGNTNLTLERFKKNCDGVKKAYDLNYQFMLEHSPKKEYFDSYRGRSCIPPMYADITRLKMEDRFQGLAYFKELFSEDKL